MTCVDAVDASGSIAPSKKSAEINSEVINGMVIATRTDRKWSDEQI